LFGGLWGSEIRDDRAGQISGGDHRYRQRKISRQRWFNSDEMSPQRDKRRLHKSTDENLKAGAEMFAAKPNGDQSLERESGCQDQ